MFACRLLGIAVLVSAGGCTHPAADVITAFPVNRGDVGSVDVILNDASRALSMTVDDALVVDRKRTRHVHVDGVPAGSAHIRVATGGRCEQGRAIEQDVVVTPGLTSTLVMPGPEPNLGCAVMDGLTFVGEEVGMVAIAITLAATAVHVHDGHGHGR